MNKKPKDIARNDLYPFLQKVDRLFPVPLSDKEPLEVLASKLEKYGTLSLIQKDGQIVAMCAGYINDLERRLGYISVVAVLPECSGRGYGWSVVYDFVRKAADAGMTAVHLYASPGNAAALKMYQKLGFVRWQIAGEPRPDDMHLIKRLS